MKVETRETHVAERRFRNLFAPIGVAVITLTLMLTATAGAQGPPPTKKRLPPAASAGVVRPPAPGSASVARKAVRSRECSQMAAELGMSGMRRTNYITTCSQR